MQLFVNSGADSLSHIVMPNQKVGRSWKFHVVPRPLLVGWMIGSRGSVIGVRQVVARPRHGGLEQHGRLVVPDVLVPRARVDVGTQPRPAGTQRVLSVAQLAGGARRGGEARDGHRREQEHQPRPLHRSLLSSIRESAGDSTPAGERRGARYYPVTMTSSRRGPWTPSTRSSSMSRGGGRAGDEGDRAALARRLLERGDGVRDAGDDRVRAHDADVVVGHERERAAAGLGAAVEHDRARVGDGQRAAGDDGVERVELGDGRAAGPRAGGTPSPSVDADVARVAQRLAHAAVEVAGGDAAHGRPVLGHALAEQLDGAVAATARRPSGRRAGRPARPAPGRAPRARARGCRPAPCSRAASAARRRRAAARRPPASGGPAPGCPRVAPPVAERLRGGSGRSRIASSPGSAAAASGPRPSLAAAARPRSGGGGERGGHALHRQRLGREPGLLLAHDPPAQVHEHGRDVDLDRADLVAGAAQRGGPGQRRRRVAGPAAAA